MASRWWGHDAQGRQVELDSIVKEAELLEMARLVRADVVSLCGAAGTAHVGSALSCVDILVAAYWGARYLDPEFPDAPDRDRLILSKGHAVVALYVCLHHLGVLSRELLLTFARDGGCLPEHPVLGCVPGVEATSGSLGHGLPLGLGMALAGRLRGAPRRVLVLMSDGECNEGSVWEAAMLAPRYQVPGLTVVVDYNRWQGTGRSDEITALQSLCDKWAAFGWRTCEVDGHDPEAIAAVLSDAPHASGKPLAVIAHTVKGKGVSFMEDDNNWHYRVPTADEVDAACGELGVSDGGLQLGERLSRAVQNGSGDPFSRVCAMENDRGSEAAGHGAGREGDRA